MYVLLVHAGTIRGGGLFAGIRDNAVSLFLEINQLQTTPQP